MKVKLIDFGLKESNIQIPEAKNYNDAGADVRLIEDISVPSHSVVKARLGFGVEVPDGMMGILLPRSGLNSKGITVLFSPIDSGYRGEVCINIYNTTDSDVSFNKGDRVGQIVIVPIINCEYTWDLNNSRGTNGFGSTGVK